MINYDQIDSLCERGNVAMDKEHYDEAISLFSSALMLLPSPQEVYDAYLWLKTSIGEAYFQKHDYAQSKNDFYDALNGPDGYENPFILLRLGQSLYQLDDNKCLDFLVRAYMLEGDKIFEDEDPKYLQLVKDITDNTIC